MRNAARRLKVMAALSLALLLPASLAGSVNTTNAALPTDPLAAGLLGTLHMLRSQIDPEGLGAGGELPEADKPSPDLLRRAEDPRTLATGAGPLVEVPSGPLGIPGPMLEVYRQAAERLAMTEPACGVRWSLLASIGRIESGHARSGRIDVHGTTVTAILGPRLAGGPGVAAISDTDNGRLDGDPVWDRAVGSMQFIPSTWARYGVDGNDDGVASPHNVHDATVSAGEYLCSGGADLRNPSELAAAVFRYNHSESYVREVLMWAAAYAEGVTPTPGELAPDTDRTDVLAGHRLPEGSPSVIAAPPSPAPPPPPSAPPTVASAPAPKAPVSAPKSSSPSGQTEPPGESKPQEGDGKEPPPPPEGDGTEEPPPPEDGQPPPPREEPPPEGDGAESPPPPSSDEQQPPREEPPPEEDGTESPPPEEKPSDNEESSGEEPPPEEDGKPPSSSEEKQPPPPSSDEQQPSSDEQTPSSDKNTPPADTAPAPSPEDNTTSSSSTASPSSTPPSTTPPSSTPSPESGTATQARSCEPVVLTEGEFLTEDEFAAEKRLDEVGTDLPPGTSEPDAAVPNEIVHVEPSSEQGPLEPCRVPSGYTPAPADGP